MSFESLGLGAPLLAAAKQRGYLGPTTIQSAAIPPALAGRLTGGPYPSVVCDATAFAGGARPLRD